MKTSLKVAYEPFDSNTVRYTSKTIGKLVSEIPDDKLDAFFDSLASELIYMTQARRELLALKMNDFINKI